MPITISGDSPNLTSAGLASPVFSGTPTGTGVLTSGTAQASTSGTSIDFTSIPSWVKRVTVMFYSVSTNGTSNLQVRLGNGGTPLTSGYQGTSLASTAAGNSAANSTTGFVLLTGAATSLISGIGVFTNVSGTLWTGVINTGQSDSARTTSVYAGINLSGTLDIVRITTVNGTDTFDVGFINILYE
jgi:hypothetical protein